MMSFLFPTDWSLITSVLQQILCIGLIYTKLHFHQHNIERKEDSHLKRKPKNDHLNSCWYKVIVQQKNMKLGLAVLALPVHL